MVGWSDAKGKVEAVSVAQVTMEGGEFAIARETGTGRRTIYPALDRMCRR